MDVHVPQAGDEVLPLAVHDRGPLRHPDLAGLADGSDPVAGDDDRHVRPGRAPVASMTVTPVMASDFAGASSARTGSAAGQGDDGQASGHMSHRTLRRLRGSWH